MFDGIKVHIAKCRLRRYFDSRFEWESVGAKELARAFLSIPSTILATALLDLVDDEFLAVFYQVQKPDGTLMGWEFFDPRDIPDQLYDTETKELVDTAPMDVVVMFRRNKL